MCEPLLEAHDVDTHDWELLPQGRTCARATKGGEVLGLWCLWPYLDLRHPIADGGQRDK